MTTTDWPADYDAFAYCADCGAYQEKADMEVEILKHDGVTTGLVWGCRDKDACERNMGRRMQHDRND